MLKAFYGVYDGHGGRAAVDFVADKLGKNVVATRRRLHGGGPASRVRTAIVVADG